MSAGRAGVWGLPVLGLSQPACPSLSAGKAMRSSCCLTLGTGAGMDGLPAGWDAVEWVHSHVRRLRALLQPKNCPNGTAPLTHLAHVLDAPNSPTPPADFWQQPVVFRDHKPQSSPLPIPAGAGLMGPVPVHLR